jgi:predicted ferric reductase
MFAIVGRTTRTELLWLAGYVAALSVPILLLLPAPSYGSGWSTFAVALGFMAYVGMALQCVLASRSAAVTGPFGSDLLIAFHRVAGVAILLAVTLHMLVIFVTQDWARGWFWPVRGPLEAQLGMLALACLLMLAGTSIRRPDRLSYEAWRRLHLGATIVAIIAAYGHALQSSPYSSYAPVRVVVVATFLASLATLVSLRLGRAYRSLSRPYVVDHVVAVGQGVHTLQLEAVDHPGIAFAPGQFAWLRIGGSAASLQEHPFSFASSSGRRSAPSFGIKQLGDFTNTIGELLPGTRVLVDGPHGDPRFPLAGSGFVCIVGGIGVTPALSIIRSAVDSGDPRPIQLIYAVESSTEIPFIDELRSHALSGAISLEVIVNHPDTAWDGHRGRVSTQLLRSLLPADARQRNIVVCGPPAMIEAVNASLDELAIPRAHRRLEGFSFG